MQRDLMQCPRCEKPHCPITAGVPAPHISLPGLPTPQATSELCDLILHLHLELVSLVARGCLAGC